MNFMIKGMLMTATILVGGCPGFPSDGTVELNFNFEGGTQGWAADVSDYSEEEAGIIEFNSGIAPLPDEINSNGRGYFVTSSNRSDDLFVFLKRELGPVHGLVAGQTYAIHYTVTIASNAPSGCIGAGGAPGESVYVKVGGSATEPEPLNPDDQGYIALSVDKGNQSSGGPAATVVGDLANGDECEDTTDAPFVSIERSGEHEVTADANGRLWLLVGTDSAFEGVTTLYYQRIAVTLTPIDAE